jgi:hypothetical protein
MAIKLNSSFIDNVSYAGGNLRIDFKSGSRHRYLNVPTSIYLQLCRAKLPGKYYTGNIKGKYQSIKLTKNQA